jgi:hypothetical protein
VVIFAFTWLNLIFTRQAVEAGPIEVQTTGAVSEAKEMPLTERSKLIGLSVFINEDADARAHAGITCVHY